MQFEALRGENHPIKAAISCWVHLVRKISMHNGPMDRWMARWTDCQTYKPGAEELPAHTQTRSLPIAMQPVSPRCSAPKHCCLRAYVGSCISQLSKLEEIVMQITVNPHPSQDFFSCSYEC